jgi:hypothetical protein
LKGAKRSRVRGRFGIVISPLPSVRYPYSDDDFRVLSRFLLVLGAT